LHLGAPARLPGSLAYGKRPCRPCCQRRRRRHSAARPPRMRDATPVFAPLIMVLAPGLLSMQSPPNGRPARDP